MVVTLSFVMTAWGATGTAAICRLTFTMRSMTGTTKKTPGPFAPLDRPSRKITPRSYSWTTFTELARTIRSKNPKSAMTAIAAATDYLPSPAP